MILISSFLTKSELTTLDLIVADIMQEKIFIELEKSEGDK
jgi:hypothetical protein